MDRGFVLIVFSLSPFRQIAATQPKAAAIRCFSAATSGKGPSRKTSSLFAQGIQGPADEISAAMFSNCAAKSDSFAATESIPETRHGYAEIEFIKFAASCEDIASHRAKIAATENNFAASDFWIEARKEPREQPLRYGGAHCLHFAP